MHPWIEWAGLSALGLWLYLHPGLCPGLVWSAPLALGAIPGCGFWRLSPSAGWGFLLTATNYFGPWLGGWATWERSESISAWILFQTLSLGSCVGWRRRLAWSAMYWRSRTRAE